MKMAKVYQSSSMPEAICIDGIRMRKCTRSTGRSANAHTRYYAFLDPWRNAWAPCIRWKQSLLPEWQIPSGRSRSIVGEFPAGCAHVASAAYMADIRVTLWRAH